jgi:hypothetical protein
MSWRAAARRGRGPRGGAPRCGARSPGAARLTRRARTRARRAQNTAHMVFSWPDVKKQARRAAPASSTRRRALATQPAADAPVARHARAQAHITVMDVKKARATPQAARAVRRRHASHSWRARAQIAHLACQRQVTRPYTADDAGQFVPIVAFDCKGCEPTAWYPDKARDCAQAFGAMRAARALTLRRGALRGSPCAPRAASPSRMWTWARRAPPAALTHPLARALTPPFVPPSSLPQGEWTEYDEKAGDSVSIMELQHEFRTHREK